MVILIHSVQSLDRLRQHGEHEGQFSRDPLSVFSARGPCEQLWYMGRAVHFLMLSIKHFLCRPRHHPPPKVPCRMVLDRLLWRVTCLDHTSFSHLTAARRGSCGPTRKLSSLCIQLLSCVHELSMTISSLSLPLSAAFVYCFPVYQHDHIRGVDNHMPTHQWHVEMTSGVFGQHVHGLSWCVLVLPKHKHAGRTLHAEIGHK